MTGAGLYNWGGIRTLGTPLEAQPIINRPV
jgi:hypothetical protein